MKLLRALVPLLLLGGSLIAQNGDSVTIRRIFDMALENGHAYHNLEYLCKKIGPRLSGSANAQKAITWSKNLMENYGFDRVYLQDLMVPVWERGVKEQAYFIEGNTKIPVPVSALGSSIATPATGLQAEILEVQSFAELKALGENRVKGKIVFFNRPFDQRFFDTFEAYGSAVDQRGQGAVEAAKLGAVGVIVRSMSSGLDDFPHTGGMRYQEGVKKIPAAAISTRAAEMLSRKLKLRKLPAIQFYLKQNCRTLPDAPSFNVIAEIRGTEKPDEIITVGGHLDSWDLAEGAHDDGAGVMQAIEALRIFKILGIRPKHTIRAVLFMNEENGLRGGLKYAEMAKLNKEKHIAAIESDEGGFTPRGFAVEDAPDALEHISKWKTLLKPYKVNDIEAGSSGADIRPLRTIQGTVLIGFKPDSQRYFDIHHSSNDVFENVNKRELELGAASIASLIYLIDLYGAR